MKAISTPLIINSFRTKKDGSMSFSAETPEISSEEKVAFMDLQGINLNAIFEPTDFKAEDQIKVKGEVWQKTPSERLYNVVYVYWTQKGGKGDFRKFYESQMEIIIQRVKNMLNP